MKFPWLRARLTKKGVLSLGGNLVKAQQGGAQDFGGEGSLGGGGEENIDPEGLFGFLLEKIYS